jgi:hypothetical protein
MDQLLFGDGARKGDFTAGIEDTEPRPNRTAEERALVMPTGEPVLLGLGAPP